MNRFQVCRPVNKDAEGCQQLAVSLLDKLKDAFGGSYSQRGNNYQYKHPAGVTALVEPRDGEISVDVKLGIMASALGPQIKSEMDKSLDMYLEKE